MGGEIQFMRDNLSVIITALILVILIIIFPLYNVFERQDDMSYNIVLKATSEFADEVLQNGYLTEEMYSNFVSELAMTGNLYDIQLEAHRKVITKDPDGNNDEYIEQSFIDYNDDIFKDANINPLNPQEKKSIIGGIYTLNEKDEFYVKVKNTNTTMAGAIFDAIIPTAKKERIIADCGGIVRNNSWAKVDAEYEAVSELPIVYAYFGDDESKKVQLPTNKSGGLGQKIDNNGGDLHIKIENLDNACYFVIYNTMPDSGDVPEVELKSSVGYSATCEASKLKPNKTYRIVVYLDSAHSQKLNDYFFYFN